MATKTEATSKVNKTAVNAVANALDKAMTDAANTGDFVTQCVKAARKYYKGKAIPDADMTATLDVLQDKRGWTEKSAPVRRSEATCLLREYNVIEEAVAAYRKRQGGCTWHTVIRLARELGKHKGKTRIARSITALTKKVTPTALNAVPRKDAKRAAAISIKRVLKHTKLEKGFRDALADLCDEYGINV